MEFDKDFAIYRQIIEIIKKRMISKEFLSGAFTPTVRSLAEEFGVTPNTMQRAFAELIYEGYLESVRGNGIQSY